MELAIRRTSCLVTALLLGLAAPVFAAEAESPENARRAAAIAEFTRRTREANYPALFQAAGKEFQVPAELLEGIAFAETRWEHLTWPPGEIASPATGMPRPYGIMSLWDNPHFGRSLVEAAALIGATPEELKRDPRQNIRGAAALLRKLYDEHPKPADAAGEALEGWRYAVRKYCGIPEPDLNARHALDVYTFISQGYHQYGIEFDARPVELEPIRAETARIVAEEQARRGALANSNAPPSVPELRANPRTEAESAANRLTNPSPVVADAITNAPPAYPSPRSSLWFIVGAIAALVLIFAAARRNRD